MRGMTAWLPVLALLANGTAAQAQTNSGAPIPATRQTEATPQPAGEADSFGGPLWQRSNLFGDPAGCRSALAAHGVTFGLQEQAEILGNASGGTRRGAVFEGLLSMSAGVDTEKAGLWSGGTFNVSGYQIHGRGLSLNNLDNNANTVSSLEACGARCCSSSGTSRPCSTRH